MIFSITYFFAVESRYNHNYEINKSSEIYKLTCPLLRLIPHLLFLPHQIHFLSENIMA